MYRFGHRPRSTRWWGNFIAERGKFRERERLGAPGRVDAEGRHVFGAEQAFHVIAQGLAAAGKRGAHHFGELGFVVRVRD